MIVRRDSKGKRQGTKGVLWSYFRSTDSFLQFWFDVKLGYGSPKLYVRHIAIPLNSGNVAVGVCREFRTWYFYDGVKSIQGSPFSGFPFPNKNPL